MKPLAIILLILVIGLCAFYVFNRHFKLIDLSSVSVVTEGGLEKAKVKIERGHFDGNRQYDSVLFAGDAGKWTVFDGHRCGLLHTDYGENDSRHFISDSERSSEKTQRARRTEPIPSPST